MLRVIIKVLDASDSQDKDVVLACDLGQTALLHCQAHVQSYIQVRAMAQLQRACAQSRVLARACMMRQMSCGAAGGACRHAVLSLPGLQPLVALVAKRLRLYPPTKESALSALIQLMAACLLVNPPLALQAAEAQVPC